MINFGVLFLIIFVASIIFIGISYLIQLKTDYNTIEIFLGFLLFILIVLFLTCLTNFIIMSIAEA